VGIKNIFFKNTNQSSRNDEVARVNRLTSDWIGSFQSSDAEIKGALAVARARGRELGRNNPFVRSWLRGLQNNVIGAGIRMQSDARDKAGNLLKQFNQDVEREWALWCRKDSCHTAGQLTFANIERLLLRNTAESGEVFVRKVYKKFGRSKVAFALQILESDLLDHNFNGEFKGNQVRMGVEVDEFNRPVAYHFFSVHPGDLIFANRQNNQQRVRVPASEIIPLMAIERPVQVRGITWLAASATSLRQLGGFIDATVIGKRVKASVMGFIQRTESEDPNDDSAEIEAGERVEDFSPGKFVHLDPGETVNVPNLGGDNGADFAPFSKTMIRTAAAGVGGSYEELSKDYSDSNYSSSQLSLLGERDQYKMLQKWIIEEFHQAVFEEWLHWAMLGGAIKTDNNIFNDYVLNKDRFNQPKWLPRSWNSIDPIKHVTAQKEALSAGLKTLTECLADDGKDFDETVAQIKHEREILKQNGIELDVFQNIGAKNETKNQNNSQTEPTNTNTEG
jgi:lambda family phage portal protein